MTITEFLEARIAEDEKLCGWIFQIVRDTEDDSYAYAKRVLAECAVKRAIIADYIGASPEAWWSQDAIKTNSKRADAWLLTLYHLATIYKDHPDYQQDWAK